MGSHPHIKKYSRYLFMVLAILIFVPIIQNIEIHKKKFLNDKIDCVIALNGYKSTEMEFSVGYNYELLGRFAKYERCPYNIRLVGKNETPLDSLGSDGLRIVVMPYKDSSIYNKVGFHISDPLSDSTVWIVPAGDKNLIREITRWHSDFKSSLEYNFVKERFSPSYEPYSRARTGKRYHNASPYDHLFKKHAAAKGLDWRMIAAIVWQESRFHIEVKSHRGAAGLMQMMPATASTFGVSDVLDPDENIEAGVRYISRLKRMFSRYSSGTDLTKMTLAAYNAGEGRILDCINVAKAQNIQYSSWADIEAIIPTMRDSVYMQTDSISRLGIFKGYETLAYVDRVMSLYNAFCTIAPGPSSPGPHSTQKARVGAKAALSQDKKPGPRPKSDRD